MLLAVFLTVGQKSEKGNNWTNRLKQKLRSWYLALKESSISHGGRRGKGKCTEDNTNHIHATQPIP